MDRPSPSPPATDVESATGTALPAGARRLFEPPVELSAETSALVIGRLLEDGDAADLAWLVQAVGEERLAAWLARRGGRQLSRRSCAFWQLVLATEAAPRPAVAEELWPL